MSNFETYHFFAIVKEENGIIFVECLSHNPPEYGVGIRKDDTVEMVYIDKNRQQAEKVYLDLLSHS
jgi:hypothetical protein